MLVRSQKGPGPIFVVNTDQVSCWEITGDGILHAYTADECFNMGRFNDVDGALRFLSRMQSKVMSGCTVTMVPGREDEDAD